MVLFLPTATGDDASYIVSFYEAFHSGRCRPRHLKLFHRDDDDLTDIVLGADVIHVGGGNTANMLDVWHRQGVDQLLFQALDRGAVLTGGSAGGLCWFEGGTTDSYGPTLQLLHEGLGMIKGSYCPHYDAEDQRRPMFHAALLDGSLEMGYASWNRVAIRFTARGRGRRGGHIRARRAGAQGVRRRRQDRRGGHPVPPARGTRRQPLGVHLSAQIRDRDHDLVPEAGAAGEAEPITAPESSGVEPVGWCSGIEQSHPRIGDCEQLGAVDGLLGRFPAHSPRQPLANQAARSRERSSPRTRR